MTFTIMFWRSNWVGKFYFNNQNPIVTFELCRKIVAWHSKSYFGIRTESENGILIYIILLWHSNWVGKSYFVIQNPILTFELSRKMLFRFSKIQIWHSNWVEKSYFDIPNPILTVEMSRKILFLYSKSYFDIRT